MHLNVHAATTLACYDSARFGAEECTLFPPGLQELGSIDLQGHIAHRAGLFKQRAGRIVRCLSTCKEVDVAYIQLLNNPGHELLV
jgi:hypothetical protein